MEIKLCGVVIMSLVEVSHSHGNANLTHLSQWCCQIKNYTYVERSLTSIKTVVVSQGQPVAKEEAEREEKDK